jgi:thiol-disulfide isomerase/thioredoxin
MDENIKEKDLRVKHWINSNGEKINELKLSQFNNKFKIIFCFQSWCPGCHSIGFPSLKALVDHFENNKSVVFFAIQTVFEGFEENSYDKLVEIQNKYSLKISFGHDAGDDDSSFSNVINDYNTGGTPWFIVINPENKIIFSGFRINVEGAIEYIQKYLLN